ncbi:hypothetical protein HNQ63_002925 [Wenzhouxiangella marina]|uniref:Uncharacterized protein n=1 Tax=Wenzhouxiangella marina TaxID=1579979 RepID=A0A0K0XSI6_9GAMM|nr:hypothetical protein WM2015_287 [Wenzhouxiangella marina]MBB6088444.1 hypothetical protein [Wenzhouxiangella marina]
MSTRSGIVESTQRGLRSVSCAGRDIRASGFRWGLQHLAVELLEMVGAWTVGDVAPTYRGLRSGLVDRGFGNGIRQSGLPSFGIEPNVGRPSADRRRSAVGCRPGAPMAGETWQLRLGLPIRTTLIRSPSSRSAPRGRRSISQPSPQTRRRNRAALAKNPTQAYCSHRRPPYSRWFPNTLRPMSTRSGIVESTQRGLRSVSCAGRDIRASDVRWGLQHLAVELLEMVGAWTVGDVDSGPDLPQASIGRCRSWVWQRHP